MLKRASIVPTLALAALASAADTAEAQHWPAPYQDTSARISESVPFVFFAETGIYGSGALLGPNTNGFAMPFVLGAYGTIADVVELGAVWGFSLAQVEADLPLLGRQEATGLVAFNPYLQGAYRYEDDMFVLRVGGGLAIPIADAGADDLDDATARLTALYVPLAMNGLLDGWLHLEDRLTLVLPAARIDSHPREVLVWAAESKLGIAIYTGDLDNQETEVLFQLAGEVGVRIANRFVVGGRLTLAVNLTADDGQDAAQLAVEPFFRVHFDPAFFQARFLMNLDDELGFAFDEGKVWSLHVGGGAYL